MIGSGVADPVGLEVTTGASTMSACSSCTSISVNFMNDDFVLYWAASIKDVFNCVLEIKLQSTRVHMYAIKKRFRKNKLPGWC